MVLLLMLWEGGIGLCVPGLAAPSLVLNKSSRRLQSCGRVDIDYAESSVVTKEKFRLEMLLGNVFVETLEHF